MFPILFLNISFADCNVAALSKTATSGAGDSSAEAFLSLLSCDANTAKRIGSSAISKFVPNDTSYQAVAGSLQIGLYKDVASWVAGLQSDEKPLVLRYLGDNCNVEGVENFFVEQSKSLGDAYWNDRWYKYTSKCQGDANLSLLETEVRKKEELDRTRYFGVLTAYARTAGVKSLPLLKEQLENESNEEVQINLIQAFSDAAGNGTDTGIDQKIAAEASGIIFDQAEKYGQKSLNQARTTLKVLQDLEKADALAGYAYKANLQEDGSLLWGVIAVENGTCKKGKKQQQVHSASVKDMRKSTWNDELKDHVRDVVEVQWEGFFTLDSKCSTDYGIEYIVPSAPFTTQDEYQEWLEKNLPAPVEGVKQKRYAQAQVEL